MKYYLSIITLLTVFISCKEDLANDSHYKIPEWSHGSAYQLLQEEGKYTSFLKAIDLTGYTQVMKGKSIITVMAPDDNAFGKYLSSKGYSSIEDFYSKDSYGLEQLITYHIMYYAFDWQKMMNFRPKEGDDATIDEKIQYAGFYYKQRTYSKQNIEMHNDSLIYHYERLLPIFSSNMFSTKDIEAATNYKYFFPNSSWCGDTKIGGGFNIANASVLDEASVITDNGYLYHIDQVIEPLPTIYDVIKDDPNYATFYNIYDSYTTYETADDETCINLGQKAYIHRHGSLPSIACEWPVTDYRSMDKICSEGYNVFAPSDKAINKMFTTFWTPGCGYTNIENLDLLIKKYFILQSFSYDKTLGYFICFPDEIKNGTVFTTYETVINIDPSDVNYRQMCSNGTFYGMDKMTIPAIFNSVSGPAFKNKDYLYHLYSLDVSRLIKSLAADNTRFLTLVPTNEQYEAAGFRLASFNSEKVLQILSEAGTYVTAGSEVVRPIINMHTATGVDSIDTSENSWQVIKSNIAFNYWYVHNGNLTVSSVFNQQLEPEFTGDVFYPIIEITNEGSSWSNGRSFSYQCPNGLFKQVEGDNLAYKLAICNDKRYDYYLFSQLLQRTGLTGVNTVGTQSLSSQILPTVDTRFVCFIPTNKVIRQQITNLPGCSKLKIAEDNTITGTLSATDKQKLSDYLKKFFITSTTNAITSYPYPGGDMFGTYNTVQGMKIMIFTEGNSFVITTSDSDKNIQLDQKYNGFPFAFSDGCVQLIDNIF